MSGSIESPDDSGALQVKLSIWDTEITLRANGTELGTWPTQAVTIRPLDAFAFEFTAEGDRLIFTPEDPDLLGSHPLLRGGAPSRRRSKRTGKPSPGDRSGTIPVVPAQQRSKKARTVRSATAPVEDAVAKSVSGKRTDASHRRAAHDDARKPTRRELRAAEDAAREAALAAEVTETVARGVISVAEGGVATPEKAPADPRSPKVPRPLRGRMPRPEREEPARAADAAKSAAPATGQAATALPREERSREPRRRERTPRTGPSRMEILRQKRHEAWIGALDMARKYDFLGLDRVPVDVAKRGGEHQHTWDHRVAATGGPGKYVCTICGAVRIGINRA